MIKKLPLEMNMPEKEYDFEKNLQRLEKIVEELTSGDMPLEKSMKKFELGVELYKQCQEQLKIVDKKITKLTETLKEEAFNPDDQH